MTKVHKTMWYIKHDSCKDSIKKKNHNVNFERPKGESHQTGSFIV